MSRYCLLRAAGLKVSTTFGLSLWKVLIRSLSSIDYSEIQLLLSSSKLNNGCFGLSSYDESFLIILLEIFVFGLVGDANVIYRPKLGASGSLSSAFILNFRVFKVKKFLPLTLRLNLLSLFGFFKWFKSIEDCLLEVELIWLSSELLSDELASDTLTGTHVF